MGKSRNEVNRIFTSDSPAIFIINFSIHNLLTYKCHGHCIVVFFLTQLIVVIFEEKKVKKKITRNPNTLPNVSYPVTLLLKHCQQTFYQVAKIFLDNSSSSRNLYLEWVVILNCWFRY